MKDIDFNEEMIMIRRLRMKAEIIEEEVERLPKLITELENARTRARQLGHKTEELIKEIVEMRYERFNKYIKNLEYQVKSMEIEIR